MNDKILIDSGFDSDFSHEQIIDICQIFNNDEAFSCYVNDLHIINSAYDLKRGEYYPEILRATQTFKNIAAQKYDIKPSQVHPNFGSNGSIDTILTSLLSGIMNEIEGVVSKDTNIKDQILGLLQRKKALVVTPTYFRNYNSTDSKTIELEKLDISHKDYIFDIQEIINAIQTTKSKLVIIVTPNNPTGVSFSRSELYSILDVIQDDQWCMIDRTLVDIDENIDTKEVLNNYSHKNIAILHSFSKFNALSHIRIGTALYSNENFANIIRPNLPLGMNIEGLVKASKLLLERGLIQPDDEIVENIKKNRAYLKEFFLHKKELFITNFVSNYALIYWKHSQFNSSDLTEYMKNKSLYIMDGKEFPEPNVNSVRLHTGAEHKLIIKFSVELENFMKKYEVS